MVTYEILSVIHQKISEGGRRLIAYGQYGHYSRIVLLGILTLGLLVQLIHFQTLTETAFLKIPLVHTQSDMYAFWQWAQTILAGDSLGRNTYHPNFE